MNVFHDKPTDGYNLISRIEGGHISKITWPEPGKVDATFLPSRAQLSFSSDDALVLGVNLLISSVRSRTAFEVSKPPISPQDRDETVGRLR